MRSAECGTNERPSGDPADEPSSAAIFRRAKRPLAAVQTPVTQIRRPQRRGYTLVLVVMLLAGLMALAGLVIDVGLARVAQRQMQTAVDAAALEGLRYRDEAPTWDSSQPPDEFRRQQASQIVEWVFDDDFDTTNGDPLQFGAGPVLELSGGYGSEELAGSQLLEVPDTPVYKPADEAALELNAADAVQGDMVAGDYVEASDSGAPENYSHRERSDYSRDDFIPAHTDRSAFLVRMRRTSTRDQNARSEGISSSGPPLPFLFARGSLMSPTNAVNDYQPRVHGLTVRATSIADAQRAKSVGVPQNNDDQDLHVIGGLPLAVYHATVDNTAIPSTVSVQVTTDGILLSGMSTLGIVLSNIEDWSPSSVGQVGVAVSVADPNAFVTQMLSAVPLRDEIRNAYLPVIFNPDVPAASGMANRLVGFWFVEVAGAGADLTFTRAANQVAFENATATLIKPVNDPSIISALFAQHEVLPEPLLAPALVQTLGP
jgi:hypothetical protein